MVHFIPCNTSASMVLTVRQGGTLRNDAVVTAAVRSPTGELLGGSISCPSTGSNGQYRLTIPPEWSWPYGEALEGDFTVTFTITRAGATATRRTYWRTRR